MSNYWTPQVRLALRHASLFPSSADLDRFLFRRSFTSSGRTALSPPSTLLAVDSSTTVRRFPASSVIFAVADLLSSHFFSLPRFLAFSTTTVPRYHSSDKTNVTAFPDGLKMLIGNPYARFLDHLFRFRFPDPPRPSPSPLNSYKRSYNGASDADQAIGWNCLGGTPGANGDTRQAYLPPNNCPNGLRAELRFPSCWNGKDLDSSVSSCALFLSLPCLSCHRLFSTFPSSTPLIPLTMPLPPACRTTSPTWRTPSAASRVPVLRPTPLALLPFSTKSCKSPFFALLPPPSSAFLSRHPCAA
jgi:hypothetical protein